MEREESWQVHGITLALLRQIASLGYTVSVFRIPSSLLRRPGFVEMHAVDSSTAPPQQYLARVVEVEAKDVDYHCACVLAEAVGIELQDG